MAVPSLVQQASGPGSANFNRTYPTSLTGWSTPSIGNLVVICVMKTTTVAITGPSPDWTRAVAFGNNPNVEIWFRIIDGTETTYVWSTSGLSAFSFDAYEFTAGPGGVWLPFDNKINATTTVGTSLSSGVTGTLTTGSQLLVSAMGCSNFFTAPAVAGGPAWSTPVLTQAGASAYAIVSESTSVAALWSWTTSRTCRAAIAAFYAKYPRESGGVGGVSTIPSTAPLSAAGIIG